MNDEEKYLELDTTLELLRRLKVFIPSRSEVCTGRYCYTKKILTKEAFDYFIEELSKKAKGVDELTT